MECLKYICYFCCWAAVRIPLPQLFTRQTLQIGPDRLVFVSLRAKQERSDTSRRKTGKPTCERQIYGRCFFTEDATNNIIMEKSIISTENAPAAIGPYSQAVKIGNMLFTSGQIGIDPKSGELNGADIEQQTEQVFRNLKSVLEAGGMGFGNVVKTTVFIAEMADFGKVNEIYARHFTENMPARSCVAAKQLPKGALVEIECVAVK